MPSVPLVSSLAQRLVFGQIGNWRSQLIFRMTGFASLAWLMARLRGPIPLTEGYAASEITAGLCYVLVFFFGPRIVLVGVCLATSVWVLADGMTNPKVFPLAERGVLILLPLYALIAHFANLFAARVRWSEIPPRKLIERVDLSFVSFVRTTALIASAFVSIHKINRDFLNTEISCLNMITEKLVAWGGAGVFAGSIMHPWFVVLSEAALPLLLWFKPRWGVLYSVLLLSMLRLTGFDQISILMIGLAFSFLQPNDMAILNENRTRLGVAFAAILLGYLIAFGLLSYYGPLTWPELGLYGLLVACTISGMYVLILRPVGSGPEIPRWPADGLNRGLVITFGLLILTNCLSPYFGFKFEYSFAMFSNLRADAQRWNSYVFPQWMRVFGHERISVDRSVVYLKPGEETIASMLERYEDHPQGSIEFIRGDREYQAENFEEFRQLVEAVGAGGRSAEGEADPPLSRRITVLSLSSQIFVANLLAEGLYEPRALKDHVEVMRGYAGALRRHKLTVTYAGESHDFPNTLKSGNRFSEFLDSLPERPLLFQPWISGRLPQTCVH